jgi:hypothetical protein
MPTRWRPSIELAEIDNVTAQTRAWDPATGTERAVGTESAGVEPPWPSLLPHGDVTNRDSVSCRSTGRVPRSTHAPGLGIGVGAIGSRQPYCCTKGNRHHRKQQQPKTQPEAPTPFAEWDGHQGIIARLGQRAGMPPGRRL